MKQFTDHPLLSARLLLSGTLIFFLAVFFMQENPNGDAKIKIHEAEKKLIELRDEVHDNLKRISIVRDQKESNSIFRNNLSSAKGISYYILRNGMLDEWSDNEPAVDEKTLAGLEDGSFISLANGDFFACTIRKSDMLYIGLILIKHGYVYENKYLVNGFNPVLGLGDDFKVSTSGDTLFLPGHQPAYTLNHDASLTIPPSGAIVSFYFLVCVLLLISIYLFLIYYSYSLFRLFLFTAFVFLVRTGMIYFKFPSGLYEHGIFSPSYYASSFYFNSLGDLLLNAGLLLVFIISYFQNVRFLRGEKTVAVLLWLLVTAGVHLLIRGLVINSGISFSLSRPADINTYSILAFTSIALLLLSFLFITFAALKKIAGLQLTARNMLIGIFLCALYASVTLNSLNKEKEKEMRKLIAQKVELRQDHVTEFLFQEIEMRISADTTIARLLYSLQNNNDELTSYLSQVYFNGYLSRFEIKAFVFDETPESNFNLQKFHEMAEQGRSTSAENLYYLNSEAGGSSYLAIIPLKSPVQRTIVITLSAPLLKSEKGFPELLMSGKQEAPFSDEYSVARYSGQSLVYEFGNYIYPLSNKNFLSPAGEYSFIEKDGYSHMARRVGAGAFIVVSKPVDSTFELLTLFSWMFSFISVAAFFIFILSLILGTDTGWYWSLTRRVQASVIFLVILTFVLVGFGTVYYINKKYINDQRKSISDQVNALWFMVSENINSASENGNPFSTENLIQLDRLARNTNIDFNIYNMLGRIQYSSQPKIFDKGIISERMNPVAFARIKEEGLTQFIHPENAGRLNYISAYAPVTNKTGDVIAFLNLPYFEKQNELNNEVSVFLSALVNIYVLLFAITVLVTIFISSLITKPLLLLQEKMSGVRLGVTNEKIEYHEKDEIGRLVNEYNRMIDELAESAQKLAKSERETAWREMAKQVAHEIKNPLTPMKLSVQHLLRTYREKQHDEALVERITSTLIQQIDTLSNIASAFSNFAQMPQPVPERLNVLEVLKQVIQLYHTETNIELHAGAEGWVYAGRDQLIGIFSNLIKNAVQSIPPERPGKITVLTRKEADRIIIEISDNGVGIPENQWDKIFIPNFTTKSSGMGLGLAIVRKIVEEANGKIWFTSTYGTGSVFFVSLPLAV